MKPLFLGLFVVLATAIRPIALGLFLVFAASIVSSVRLCGARTRGSGEPCRRPVGPWRKRCRLHGGAGPWADQEAQETMLAARDWAVKRVHDYLSEKPPCDKCGRSDDPDVILRAVKIVLDRTGLGPTATLNVTHTATAAPWLRWLTTDELRDVMTLVARAKERMLCGVPEVVPGEYALLDQSEPIGSGNGTDQDRTEE